MNTLSIIDNVPLSGNLMDTINYFTQPNRQYSTNNIQTFDDDLGKIPTQPNAVRTKRLPIFPLICVFDYKQGKNQVMFEYKINNVVQIYVDQIFIKGIVGLHDGIFINTPMETTGSLHRNIMSCGKLFPSEGIFIQGNSISGNNLLYERFRDQLWKNYKDPKSLTNMTIELLNDEGVPVEYERIIMTFYVQTENWQLY